MLLLLLAACGPRPGGPPSVNGDPSGEWPALPALDRAIVSIMNRDVVAGLAACAVKDGETVWCGGYGERDTDSGALAYPDTPFLLASASKAVTGVAAMQAVGDGALDLDADVSTFLPFTVTHPASPSRPITTRHLMSHVAGIRDNWDVMEAHYVEGDSSESLGGFLEGYLSVGGADYVADRNFLPDGVEGAYEYTNIGAALVGYAVEVTTGTPLDRFCDERIFEPLAMNAGWHLADFDVEDVALPTRVVDGEFRTVPHFGFPDYPDGQLRADARAMARFVAMLAEGGALDGTHVLPTDLPSEMFGASYPEIEPTQGLILYRWSLDGERVWGHNGGETGTSTEILLRDGDGAGVVVLMNSTGKNTTLADVERAILAEIDAL